MWNKIKDFLRCIFNNIKQKSHVSLLLDDKRIRFRNYCDNKILVEYFIHQKRKSLQKSFVEPREGYFDHDGVRVLNAFVVDDGILFFYYVTKPCCSIGAVLFDKTNPTKILWRSANPIIQEENGYLPLKIKLVNDHIEIDFKRNLDDHKVCFSLKSLLNKIKIGLQNYHEKKYPLVERHIKNPIIEPIPLNEWESCATFNPAAISLDGKIHFIYRAIGNSGMSVLGYASSMDGIHIDERLSKPVYIPTEPFEFRGDENVKLNYSYFSGGNWGSGWGGCEDPRLSRVDDTIYMTYTAFNGCEPPGVALTAIHVDDFLNKKWKWRKPILISPRGQINKNWVVFPEKIHGKYAILHSITPQIGIDYFDDLDFKNGKQIQSIFGPMPRNGSWDNQPRGVGPTPIKTNDGWLVLYHAMDKNDPNKYKLGAMILDYENPTKILYRAIRPVLEPNTIYEKTGYKHGVIYSCGAVVVENKLFVYYGGADTVSCVATADFDDFLQKLKISQNYAPRKGLTAADIIKKRGGHENA